MDVAHELRTPIAALRLTLEDLALWPETAPPVAHQLHRATRELERLAQAVDELVLTVKGEQDEDPLTRFAGHVSHDLRQPLTALLANAEMLALEPAVAADADTLRMAEATFAAGGRMARMIDLVDAYARAGEETWPSAVPLGSIVDEVQAELGSIIQQRNAQVHAVGLPEVHADRSQLSAVIYVLISRALATPVADVSATVNIRATAADGDWVITVTDSGQIVPEERRTGLAWDTVRRVVTAHGGMVGFDEAAGGGNAVWFTLPA